MADKASRFVIIDGVQYSRERAQRLGLLKADEPQKNPTGAPSSSRARSSESTRKAAGGTTKKASE